MQKEKNKEIEKYRNANIIVMGERSQGKKHLMKIKIKELQNQKAIEQLEKVKEIVKHFCEIHSDDYYGVKSQVMGIRQDVFEFIDQQIKQLRSE